MMINAKIPGKAIRVRKAGKEHLEKNKNSCDFATMEKEVDLLSLFFCCAPGRVHLLGGESPLWAR